jgi:hypothetical protein
MSTLKEFCEISATMEFNMVGKTPSGLRIDVPFAGVATSKHWEGERAVNGTDHVLIRKDGNAVLDIRARIGEGRDVIWYSATGISRQGDRQGLLYPQELILFETGSEDFAYLNITVGVATGAADGGSLELTVYLVE